MQATQSTETWQRMWSVYHDALDRPADVRREFVIEASGADQALRSEVLSLLESHELAGAGFLNQPRAMQAAPHFGESPPPAAPLTGRRIGRYLVGRMLAEGGSATVYEAQQFDPPKTVALKVIRRGLADRRAIRRFETEAHVLARLEHPGIAQVFEAGSFDLGDGAQPYFAMELVRGERLTDFASVHSLEIRQRVRLIIDACEAVHHAHLRGVIHRDLKPSNMLVEGGERVAEARIRVLDFGVAQLTDGDLGATRATVLSEVAGTLPYMSPEQAGGDARLIDARSDVYALGVVGYELLAGTLPLQFQSSSLFDAIRVIRDQEPARLGSIDGRLCGDLELIVHKALEKEAARRYASAADFAADLRRWLNREPITARPATRRYRLTRFVQRNKSITAGLSIAIIALAAGTAVATWQAVQARRAEGLASTRAANARALAASVIQELQQKIQKLPETTPLRAELIRFAIEFLEDADNEFNDDPELLMLVGRAHYDLARALGSPRGASLNDPAAAIVEYERAVAALTRAHLIAPERHDVRQQEGYARMGMTDVLRATGRIDEAIAQALHGARIFRELAADRAGVDSLESVGLYRLGGEIAATAGHRDVAADALAKSRAVLDTLRSPPENEHQEQLYLGRTWAEYGRQLIEASRDLEAMEALNHAESVVAAAGQRGAPALMVKEFTIDAIRCQCDVLLAERRYSDTLSVARRCSALCEEVLQEQPAKEYLRSLLALSLQHESKASLNLGDHEAAIASARRSLDRYLMIREKEPGAGYFVGLEWMGRLWLINTLVTAAEQSATPGKASGWAAEARAVLIKLDEMAREAAAAGILMTASEEKQRELDRTLAELRARLAALSR